jgi:ArsR family transcriptional regulator
MFNRSTTGGGKMVEFTICGCGNAVQHAMDTMPDVNAINHVAELFKLCGDSTRVGILCALSRHELCVCEIASVLSMSSSAVSHQLRLLKQTGIISSQRRGKSVMYSISDKRIEEIFSLALSHAEDTK